MLVPTGSQTLFAAIVDCSRKSTQMTFWGKLVYFYFLMLTMNIPDLSPPSFHDAHQDLSPASGLNATPASAATVSTPVEDTPIGQRCLFAEASTRKSDNDDEELEDTCQRNGAWLFSRIQNDIDMALVKIEAGRKTVTVTPIVLLTKRVSCFLQCLSRL
jgi:hypothetical protein